MNKEKSSYKSDGKRKSAGMWWSYKSGRAVEFGGRGSGVEGVEERDEKRGNGNARVFIAWDEVMTGVKKGEERSGKRNHSPI